MPKVTPEVLDWNKQWYPVHAVRDLDPTKPHPVTLLGLPPNHTCLACTLLQSTLLAQATCILLQSTLLAEATCLLFVAQMFHLCDVHLQCVTAFVLLCCVVTRVLNLHRCRSACVVQPACMRCEQNCPAGWHSAYAKWHSGTY